jgi:hypothetical protein
VQQEAPTPTFDDDMPLAVNVSAYRPLTAPTIFSRKNAMPDLSVVPVAVVASSTGATHAALTSSSSPDSRRMNVSTLSCRVPSAAGDSSADTAASGSGASCPIPTNTCTHTRT